MFYPLTMCALQIVVMIMIMIMIMIMNVVLSVTVAGGPPAQPDFWEYEQIIMYQIYVYINQIISNQIN